MFKYLKNLTIIVFLLTSCEKGGVEKLMMDTVMRYDYPLKKGKYVVISYDDSPKTDYTLLKDLHNKLQIPAEIGVWTNKVSSQTISKDSITINNLNELFSDGFDIINHSKDHISLGRSTLLKDHFKGETNILTNTASTYVLAKEKLLDAFKKEEYISTHTLKRVLSFGGNTLLEIDPALSDTLNQYDYFTLNNDEIKNQILNSQEFLETNFQGTQRHFTLPFGLNSPEAEQIFEANQFISVRLATPNRNIDLVKWIYEDQIPDLFNINSVDLLYIEPEILKAYLKQTASENTFLILFTHSWDQNFSENKLTSIVNVLKNEGYKFTTRTKYFND